MLKYNAQFSIVLVAKWLTLRFAKPPCVGSNPTQDSRDITRTFPAGMVELVGETIWKIVEQGLN